MYTDLIEICVEPNTDCLTYTFNKHIKYNHKIRT